jgi:hypothetical protein
MIFYSGPVCPSRWSIREVDDEFVVGEFYQEAMRIDSNGNVGIGTGSVFFTVGESHKFKTREWAELCVETFNRLDQISYDLKEISYIELDYDG